MPQPSSQISQALHHLEQAVKILEQKIQKAQSHKEIYQQKTLEVQFLNMDRHLLMQELEEAAKKQQRLLTANKEVAHQLVKIMDKLRLLMAQKSL